MKNHVNWSSSDKHLTSQPTSQLKTYSYRTSTMLQVLHRNSHVGGKTVMPLQWACLVLSSNAMNRHKMSRSFTTGVADRNGEVKWLSNRHRSQRATVRSYYNSTPSQKYNQEIEKLKYDQLLRDRIIKSSILNNTPLQDKRKLSLKTIVLLIIASSTLTMMAYVVIELVRFNYEDGDETNDQQAGNGVHAYQQQQQHQQQEVVKRRTIFLPLWLNFNFLWQKTFAFPSGIAYMDKEFYQYLLVEMDQLNNDKLKSDLDNYLQVLESDNIKYSVLEQVSLNSKVKEMFGLPLSIDTISDTDATVNSLSVPKLKLWIESKYMSVSGIQLQIERIDKLKTTDNDEVSKKVQTKDTKVNVIPSWIVKPINIASSINNVLISLGLKLDRLDNEQIKTHEKSSGKIHEVPIIDKNKPDHSTVINGNKDYEIKFSGELKISDNNQFEVGILRYQGRIDFDHLMINRGIKIQSIDLIVNPKSNPTERIKYKVL